MNPVDLVKQELSAAEWDGACRSWREPIEEMTERSPFVRHRLFIVRGPTGQFDFTSLPHGSLAYFAANGFKATRLTREGKEIESILAAEWDHLPNADPVRLASLVLMFYDDGIHATHRVLNDADALRTYGKPAVWSKDYRVNETEFAKALPEIGSTRSCLNESILSVRAVTLCGWMHDKRNLGIESFTIDRMGTVSFAYRQVLSTRIFDHVPPIRY